MKFLLEIAAFNYASAMLAANVGADRIELCDNMHEGGTSPSYGTVKMLLQKLSIPLFAMLRPRGGDFLYNDEEIEVMLKDLALYKELGCAGVVFGFLKQNGSIDKELTQRFVDAAYPMEVTYHRAFDRAANPQQAMEDIVDCGCQRILTSGQQPTAPEGANLIAELVRQANDRIIILPGSGIRAANLHQLVHDTGAAEFHSSAKLFQPSAMNFVNDQMQETLVNLGVDQNEIKAMKQVLERLQQ